VLLCLAWLIGSARAAAEPPEPVELEWNAPAECPQLDEVRARIRKLSGSRKSSVRPRAAATITRKDDGAFHLTLVVHTDNITGTRNIDGRSCSDLAGATAVALVLLLQSPQSWDGSDRDGATTVGPQSPGSESTEPSSTAAKPETPADVAAVITPKTPTADETSEAWRSSRGRHVLVRLPAVTVGWGPVPGPSIGLTAAGGLSLERWSFLAGGTGWLTQHPSKTDAGGQKYGGDVNRFTAQLLACRAIVRSRLEIAPCAELYLHHMWVRGTGAHIAARTATATWLGLGLGVQARLYAAPWFAVILRAGGELETSRPRLSLENLGGVEQLLPAAATVALGTEWIF
jgi:hypothetical protein